MLPRLGPAPLTLMLRRAFAARTLAGRACAFARFRTETTAVAAPAWCGPCRQVAPVMDQIAAEYDGSVKVAKVDVDAETALAGHFGVSSIPTIAFFEPGEEPKAVVGALPKEMVESAFELDRFTETG